MLTLFTHLQAAVATMLATSAHTLNRRRDERGSVTIETVMWAVAVIGIVGVVVAAIWAYVETQSGKIK